MSDIPNLDDFSAIPEGPGPSVKRDFDWKKSTGIKIGVAAVLVLLTVSIVVWQVTRNPDRGTAQNTTVANQPTPFANNTPTPPPPAPVAPPPETNPSPNPNPGGTPPSPTPGQPETPPGTPPGPQGYPPGPQGGYPMPGANPGAADKPALPEDFTKWTKEDFQRARRENYQGLEKAVYATAQNKDLLPVFIDLLKPVKAESAPNPNDPPQPYAQPSMPASAQLIESIVFILAENATKPAKEALSGILAGDFPTDDDRVATEAVLKSMAAHPNDANDDVFLKLLTQPEEVRKASSRPANPTNLQPILTPADLRTKAEELIKLSASDNLRLKLAGYFVKSGVEPNNQTYQFLLQEDPANLGAQLALYNQVEDLGEDTKTKFLQYFTNYASLAVGLAMGVPAGVEGMPISSTGATPGSGPNGYPGMQGGYPGMQGYPGRPGGPGYSPTPPAPDASREKITDADRGIKLANAMWTGSLVATLNEQLNEVRSLEKSVPTIVLASTLPLDSVRGAMYRMLKKRQSDGPQALDAAGLADRVLNDPGMLVLMKMLNRREPKAAKGAPPRTPGGPGYGPSPSGAAATKAEAAQKKLQTENDWYNESLKLSSLWCSRFSAAAQAQKKAKKRGTAAGEPSPTKPDDLELPKEKDTKLEEAYQLNWPEKAVPGLATAKPGMLKIQYFRLTQTGTIKKTMTNLKKGLKNVESHETDKGLWTEIVPKTSGASAPRRSLDIFVTRLDKSPYDPTQKEDPTELEIHILAVEIADPGAAKE